MKVLFRTDASLAIGTGHVMRCLCLARALRAHGADVHFACRTLAGHQQAQIRNSGFEVHALPAPTGAWTPPSARPEARLLEVDTARDADETRELLESTDHVDLLVVDHYAVDADWESALRPQVERILVVDDLNDRPHDADIYLNPGLRAGARDNACEGLRPGCARLVGPRYALLRPEFAAARRGMKQRDGRLRCLFVFMGGVDRDGYTSRVLDAAALLGDALEQIDVLIGGANPQGDQVAARCARDSRLRLYRDVDNPAPLMGTADFAVGAGGTATWERACVGLPALILISAPNQRQVAEAMAAAGAALALPGSEATPEAIAEQLKHLMPEQLRAMSKRSAAIVDGRGVERVLRVLSPPHLTLRRATEKDSDAVGMWRNEPSVRRYAYNPAPINKEEHARWFASAIRDPDRALLIAEHDNKPVGVLRYDCEGNGARVSVYLVPGCSGKGYGTAILRKGSRWLHDHQPHTQRVVANVLPDNTASHYAFAEAGYRPEADTYVQELCS